MNRRRFIIGLLSVCLLFLWTGICAGSGELCAQTGRNVGSAVLKGRITDAEGKPVDFVAVGVVSLSKPIGTTTGADGTYELRVPAEKELRISFSHASYDNVEQTLRLKRDEVHILNIRLKTANIQMEEVEVKGTRQRGGAYVSIAPVASQTLPSITGGVEGLIMSLPGVNNNNELSSQYSVRGGNFDENLVYVNGIEVYRPFLTRSGEQEGLTFVNPDLVQTLTFSAGGFDAKYGDKMSSVLDIRYKQPSSFAGSFGINFMGGHAHVEGASKDGKFSYLCGLRQKNSQLVLRGLDKDGQYKPSFTDFQTLLAYEPDKRNRIELLGNISHNIYKFTPISQQTKFGGSGAAKSFWVDFDGYETDKFTTYFAALSWTHSQTERLRHKLTGSFFNTVERESFDIEGFYRLSEISGDDNGTAIEGEILGEGHYMDHARNYLNGLVAAMDYQGSMRWNTIFLQWGAKYQYEDIIDNIDEWHLEDSAGYNLPSSGGFVGDAVEAPALQQVYRSQNRTQSHRANLFIQSRFDFNTDDVYVLDVGIRSSYWSFNNEFTVSPRINFNIHPKWKRDVTFRLAAGHYAQPPFYKEMRDIYGTLHSDVRSQKSVHALFSADVGFRIWNRPFKLTAEAYYKYLYDLNPYEVDNVRVRYMAENSGKGYAAGLDFRFGGEFLEGTNSWISLSFMDTRERISYTDADGVQQRTSWIPRPTNQLFSLNLYFEDYLNLFGRKKNLKLYLNGVYSTGLPSGDSKRLADPSRFTGRSIKLPDYKRVDVGMSFLLKGASRECKPKNPLRYLKDIWLTLELFNMFQMRNTISYTWIPTVDGLRYAIPNTLTPLQVNVKLDITF